jgi:biotin carboxylase
MSSELPKRVLLLLTARTYRAKAFKEAADRLGVEVCAVVDMKQELAEYWNYPLGVDFTDQDKAIEAIKSFAQKKPVGAVLSVDDSGSAVAALASQELGLRHNAPDAALAARDKYMMRSKLHKHGVKVPDFSLHCFPTEKGQDETSTRRLADEIAYPIVIKPVNLSGSRGVIRVNSPDEFTNAVERLHQIMLTLSASSDSIPYLIESYIDGVEVAVEGLLDDGKLQVLAIFDKPDPLVGPYFEETIYVTPSELTGGIQDEIAACTSAAAKAIGLREGSIHAELRINDGGVWVIEIAGRSIGGMCSQTLRFGVEESLEELIIRQALGMEFQSFKRENLASGVMMIPIPQRGILRGVRGIQKAEKIPLIERVEITARLNYSLLPLPEGDSYLGFIFARGTSTKAVESALRKAHGELEFDILPELIISPEHKYFNFQT